MNMEMPQMAKQMVEFQKVTFNNAFNTLTMFQDQAEKLVNTFLDQNPAIPQQSREAFRDWLNMCKKARDDYKKTIDDSFKNLESYLSDTTKSK